MNDYWILYAVVLLVMFAIGERYAFNHPERQNTLSRAIYDLGSTWPLSIFLMGLLAGGLAVHFYWHWCPAGSLSLG